MSVSIDTYQVTQETIRPKNNVKQTQLGDGYQQIFLDGLNYDREEIDIQFIHMNATTVSGLKSTLLNSMNGPSNLITYTPQAENSSNSYIAKNISVVGYAGYDIYQVSCILEKQFPIA